MTRISRREALRELSGLLAIPLVRWPDRLADPLAGTIAEYQAGRLRGDWTAVQVTKDALDRAAAWNGALHAIDQLSKTALKDARASDTRLRRSALRGPLDGVPVFAKAIYDMDGLPTTGSNLEWSRLFPEAVHRDSIEVARMRSAGAVVLGKTVADDFAYHGNGTSSLSGQVRNPYDSTGTKTPGGSSAGSAVSVATGIAFAALGTDDGGSNRIPAQFTGIVGMKPTFGLVPRTGVIPTWPYLDTHGPLARYVADAALLLDAIAGPDASDGLALRTPWRRGLLADLSDSALRGARLGLVESHFPRAQMSAESISVFERAIADLKSAGAIVETFAAPVTRVNYRDLFAEAAKARGDLAPNGYAPAPTANALYRYFLTHNDDARRDVERGLAPYQAFYDVLPKDWREMQKLIVQPYEEDASGLSFARSRTTVVAQL
ncbi:MAG TPA: amidase, partial [Gemmatimonadaceae bacterium]|nr:amidase [Gemmatimonadaceae bacterium]